MARLITHKPDTFQQQAIDSTARGIRIVAPAGSGKSETLARRVAKRIKKDGVDPSRILILTFDNAAKKSLWHYFDGLDISKTLLIRTYDDFAKDLIKKYFPGDISRRWNFVDDKSTNEMVRQIRGEFQHKIDQFKIASWDGSGRNRDAIFRAIKNEGYSPLRLEERQALRRWLASKYFRLPPVPEELIDTQEVLVPSQYVHSVGLYRNIDRLIDCLTQYDEKMTASGFRDLIDRKLRAIELLRDNADVLKIVKDQYREIVVDEAQDLSRSDALLVWLAANENAHVVLAGDDDQTIYHWKNASSRFLKDPTLIFGTERKFDLVTLDLNYRSPKAILDPALELVSHNVDRIEKYPESAVKHDGSVIVEHFENTSQLEQSLLKMIRFELQSGTPAEELAVIAFTNNHQTELAAFLRHVGIPVATYKRDGTTTSSGVHVITDYKAKGNEWPVVFLAYVNDDNIPSKKSLSSDDLESKRRQMYVTLTRATQRLVILYTRTSVVDEARKNQRGDIIWTNGASRFLFEAGLVGQRPAILPPEVPQMAEELNADSVPVTRELTQPVAAEGSIATPTPTSDNVHLDTAKPSKPTPKSRQDLIDQAVRDNWHDLEGLLRRIAQEHQMIGGEPCSDIIDYLHQTGILDTKWKQRLTVWRTARNHAEHHLFALNLSRLSRSSYTARVNDFLEMFQFSQSFLRSILENPAKGQTRISDRLIAQSQIVGLIARHQLGEDGALPLRTFDFPSSCSVEDILAFQFHLIIRDLRFHCTDDIRWDRSPLFAAYAESMTGIGSEHITPSIRNRLRAESDEDRKNTFAVLNEILDFECPDPGTKTSFLLESLRIAYDSANGTLSDGVILQVTN